MIDLGEEGELSTAELRLRTKEAPATRLRAQPAEERGEPIAVSGRERPD
jgi:hypothetical protein